MINSFIASMICSLKNQIFTLLLIIGIFWVKVFCLWIDVSEFLKLTVQLETGYLTVSVSVHSSIK